MIFDNHDDVHAFSFIAAAAVPTSLALLPLLMFTIIMNFIKVKTQKLRTTMAARNHLNNLKLERELHNFSKCMRFFYLA
jgi:hypothetical protein